MEVLILQIVTIVVSVMSIGINSFIIIFQSRKKNYLDFVTRQRQSNMLQLRETAAVVLSLAAPESVETFRKSGDASFVPKLLKSAFDIELLLKRCYKPEAELLEEQKKLVDGAIAFFGGAENLYAGAMAKYKYLVSVYDHADWRFLKKQVSGKAIDSDEYFRIYKKTLQEAADAEKPN